MPQVHVEMTGDEARLWQSLQRIVRGEQQVAGGFDAIGKQAKEAAKEQKQLERAATRYYEATRTPQERYNAKLKELDVLLQKGKVSQDTYTRAVKQAKGEMDAAGQAGKSAFGQQMKSAIGSLTTMLMGGAGLAGAINLVKQEYENMIEVQGRAKEASVTVAQAEIAALRNLGATTAGQREVFVKEVSDISATTGVSQKALYGMASTALSARGELSQKAAMGAVREAAMIAPESPEEATQIAGAALDLAKITKTDRAQANIGLLMAIGQTARVTDIGELARNVAPAITGITARGGTAQEAGAIWSALTQGMADPTGRLSGTAAISLAEQLATFEGTAGRSTTLARIQALQRDAGLRQEFFEGASFEKKAQASIEQMLAGKGSAAEALSQFLTRIPGVGKAEGLYQQRLGVIRGSELQQTAQIVRVLESGLESLQIANQPGARIGALREKYATILKDTGLGALATRFQSIGFEAGGVDLQAFIQDIETRAAQLKTRPEGVVPAGRLGMWTGPPAEHLTPTPVELRQAQVLERMAESLRRLELLGERQLGVQREQRTIEKSKRRPTMQPVNVDK